MCDVSGEEARAVNAAGAGTASDAVAVVPHEGCQVRRRGWLVWRGIRGGGVVGCAGV